MPIEAERLKGLFSAIFFSRFSLFPRRRESSFGELLYKDREFDSQGFEKRTVFGSEGLVRRGGEGKGG